MPQVHIFSQRDINPQSLGQQSAYQRKCRTMCKIDDFAKAFDNKNNELCIYLGLISMVSGLPTLVTLVAMIVAFKGGGSTGLQLECKIGDLEGLEGLTLVTSSLLGGINCRLAGDGEFPPDPDADSIRQDSK